MIKSFSEFFVSEGKILDKDGAEALVATIKDSKKVIRVEDKTVEFKGEKQKAMEVYVKGALKDNPWGLDVVRNDKNETAYIINYK